LEIYADHFSFFQGQIYQFKKIGKGAYTGIMVNHRHRSLSFIMKIKLWHG